MKALILAAGFGIRLREVLHGRPKHLASINGKPFLRHLIELLKKNDIKDIVIAVGYLSDHITKEFGNGSSIGVNIKYSIDNRPLGTAGTVGLARKFFKKEFLVVNGDTYVDVDHKKIMEFHKNHKALVTIVATSRRNGKGGVISVQNNKAISFQTPAKKKLGDTYLENTGLYVFSQQALKEIKNEERCSLEKDLFPRLINQKKNVMVYKIKKKYIDIGTPESLKEAESELSNKL